MSPSLRPKVVTIGIWVTSFIMFTSFVSAKNIFNGCGNEFSPGSTPPCPPATLKIHQPGFICDYDDPFQMQLTIIGLTGDLGIYWSGEAIIDTSGWFDPQLGVPGPNTVFVNVVQGDCVYTDSIVVLILAKEIVSFELDGVPCIDSIIHLNFNGYAYASSDWHWDFGGAQSTVTEWPSDYSLQWDVSGSYELSLWIDRHGCISDTFLLPVTIGQYLEPPQITCVKEDYNSLEIAWEPVEGASAYMVTSSFGSDTVSGNTFTLNQLPYSTSVGLEVTALQRGGCGPSETSSIHCTTLPYVTPAIYIPNVFSPNNDGINDLIYVQSNAPVKEVNKFIVFDRWGNIVFEDQHFPPNDPTHGWNGKFSGDFLNPAVYTYQAELSTVYQDQIKISGDITLVK
jgi:gliding motility-associated-like protein